MSASPVVLDTSGLKCPLPVLKARKALRDVPTGGVLRVIATDPGAVKDFEHFCKTTGHRLLAHREEAGKLVFEIEKAD
ncbi:MAG TPA: sulfurtransferase TusA family protein [Stellaceae bacterium]|nr:sulfurtransferase TusA family protein [Stellaceae bacterium]